MSLIKKICLLFLIVIVLAVGTITLLLSTGFGIRFIVNTAAGWVPGLEISQVEGNLKHLRLSGVAYKTQGIDASAGELSLGIDFSCLTNSRICISELTTKGVNVAIDTALMPPAPSEPEAKPLDELSTPFPIELRLLALDDTKLNVDGTLIALNTFSTGALWQQREIALTPTVIEGLTVSIPKTARPEVDQRPTQSSPVQAPLGETLQNLFSQPLVADLPQISLPVDIVIEKIEGRNLRFVNGEETQLIDQILLKASAKLSDITIETLKVSAPQGTVALTGQASFSKNWPLSLTLNSALNVPELRGEKVRIVLNGEMLGDLKLAVNVSGPVSAQLDADVGLAKPELPLSLTLESKHIQWPVSGKADYNANNLRLRLTGKATDYVLSLRTEISGRDIPPSNITLDGKGNTQRFKLSRLRLNALEGKTELSGVADWSKAISWNLLLTLDGINTLKQWPEWPATIQGKVTNKGSIYGGSWQLEFPEINLNGQVKKQRLSVMGSARGNAAGQWRIPELLIALGKNKIEAKGELAKSWALDASISAPNLNESVPGLRGNVKGLLKLRGTEKAPQLLANLTANGIRWQDFSVAKVSLNGDITSSTQISGDMNLLMERLIVGDNRIRQLTLSANGNEKSHRLLFNADGKQIGGNLTLTGHVNRAKQYWEGSLSNTAFTTPLGNWRLSKDVTLNYSNVNQEATIGAHCWLNPDAEVCLPKAAKVGKTGQVVVDLNRFDLTILKHILQDTGLKGGFSGKADFKWADNGQLPQGSVHLQGKGVEITERLNGNSLPIAFEDIKLNATIRRQNVNLDWIVKLVSNGQFNGNVQVTDPQNARRLSGNITVDRLSLALLKPALADNEKATGILNGSLRLAGSSKAPQILGNLNLQQLALDTQWSPVTVTEGDIKLTFKGFSSALEGVIKTRRGNLTLNGNADWRKVDAWRAKITAKGEKVRIEMPPIVQLDVSPDVTVEASPELVKLDGSVSIPWAKISVKEIPESAVGVSSDEVILNTNLQPVTAQTNSVKIVSNLAINIGPNVAIDAFGLKSMLSGKLKMAQDNKGLGLHGEITLKNGNFRAYGQDLLIKKGLIIFSGPPDRPQLNISAVRNPDATEDGVTAGINVTGFADSPKLEIFSDPAMSQEAALSYLLRGQGLDKSSDDNAMMTSLLIGMGVARSGKLVGKIGETFGVKDLSLDTQGVGDSSQVVVSGYVLPGLQVKYGVGIFDSLATLTLRYRLMPRLYLEGVSGLDQALDILYQFEF